MPLLQDLVTAAAKVAIDGAAKGKGIVKEVISTTAAFTAGEAAEKTAQKIGAYRTNRYGEQVLKIPFFKTTDDKIEEAFAEHPERNKMCFHFTDSIREGVLFYDPEGNVVFEIRQDKKNLKHLELYEGNRYVGRIDKHITINLNPFADIQKYDAYIRNSKRIITVNGLNAGIDNASWSMKRKHKKYIIENNQEEEIGKFYSLGFFNFVLDYDDTVDPVELLLCFMAVKIRIEEVKINHKHSGRGDSLWIEDVIADFKDIF